MKLHEINESISKIPKSKKEIKGIHALFDRPVPMKDAKAYLKGLIHSDDLYDVIDHEAERFPDKDARELIANWIGLYLPNIFGDKSKLETFWDGTRSPIFGSVDDMKPE